MVEPACCDRQSGEVEGSFREAISVCFWSLPAGWFVGAVAIECLSLVLVAAVVAAFDVVGSCLFIDCMEVSSDCMNGFIKTGLSKTDPLVDFGAGVGVFIGVVSRLLLMLPP